MSLQYVMLCSKNVLTENIIGIVFSLSSKFLFMTPFPDNLKSSHQDVFFKIAVLKHFTKSPGNHQWWSVFVKKSKKDSQPRIFS